MLRKNVTQKNTNKISYKTTRDKCVIFWHIFLKITTYINKINKRTWAPCIFYIF